MVGSFTLPGEGSKEWEPDVQSHVWQRSRALPGEETGKRSRALPGEETGKRSRALPGEETGNDRAPCRAKRVACRVHGALGTLRFTCSEREWSGME